MKIKKYRLFTKGLSDYLYDNPSYPLELDPCMGSLRIDTRIVFSG